ncbi:Tfp pilus assembly protein PilV [Aminobacter ciceronei]|uniref:Tfp pilus assembly protein PilV n=1 Tax=Aminobacter ciceronei TaxID=150723 RepID=A0ABR6CG69_9HYPH|nr:Tfp pilus assembly protein PilV [Aminobacter ciceronei]MBA9024017.1 Tfp pilus assembly protein PilV [Aminobacter ciceronei]
MEQMMSGGMWGMSFVALVFLIVAVLGIAALVKYLFFR